MCKHTVCLCVWCACVFAVYCVCAAGWQCTSLTAAFVLFLGKLWRFGRKRVETVEESVFSCHVTVPTLFSISIQNVVFKCSSTSSQASHLLIQQKATSRNRSAKLRPDPSRENAEERKPHSQNPELENQTSHSWSFDSSCRSSCCLHTRKLQHYVRGRCFKWKLEWEQNKELINTHKMFSDVCSFKRVTIWFHKQHYWNPPVESIKNTYTKGA